MDFDGTLSNIVAEPSDATAVPGAGEALAVLAERLDRVAVVSGRPAAYLAERLADSGETQLIGLYGMQAPVGPHGGDPDGLPAYRGVSSLELQRWKHAVESAAKSAELAGITGVSVERKGLTVTLHYREDPTGAPAAIELAGLLATDTGLTAHLGKMSIELAPPLGIDKGTVVGELSQGLAAVMFVGDDVGDLPAFRAMDRLASTGVATLKVAVGGDEAPDELIGAADVLLDGPPAVVALLRWIADSIGAAPAR